MCNQREDIDVAINRRRHGEDKHIVSWTNVLGRNSSARLTRRALTNGPSETESNDVAARNTAGTSSSSSEKNSILKSSSQTEEDTSSDVFGDENNEVLRDGRLKADVMKNFMWNEANDAQQRTDAENLVTVPWWAGKRIMSTIELEPDLQKDPNSWFEPRQNAPPFNSLDFDPNDEETYQYAEAVVTNSTRRPHMRREGEHLNKHGEPRVQHDSIQIGQKFLNVPIASLSWNIGIGVDIGADYDA